MIPRPKFQGITVSELLEADRVARRRARLVLLVVGILFAVLAFSLCYL